MKKLSEEEIKSFGEKGTFLKNVQTLKFVAGITGDVFYGKNLHGENRGKVLIWKDFNYTHPKECFLCSTEDWMEFISSQLPLVTDKQQIKCADIVQDELDRTIHDLRLMWAVETDDVDTLEGELSEKELQEYQEKYKEQEILSCDTEEEKQQILEYNPDLEDLKDTIFEAIKEDLGNINEYGLCFDYVSPGTFTDQREGYFRWQLSTGGPGDEFRFYVNPDCSVHLVEYWFLNWSDGAQVILSGSDEDLLLEIWESLFRDQAQYLIEKEREGY